MASRIFLSRFHSRRERSKRKRQNYYAHDVSPNKKPISAKRGKRKQQRHADKQRAESTGKRTDEIIAGKNLRPLLLPFAYGALRRVKRLREVLQQLPPKCRTAVALQYWHGMTYEEISVHLGVSTHMVKKYLSQALTHCRRRMSRMG